MEPIDPVITFSDPDNLNALLAQPSPNLEEILDQDSVIQEIKTYTNDQLIAYLTEHNNLEKLASYVSEPPSDTTLKLATQYKDLKTTKFPFIACEILSSGNEKITRHFVGLASSNDKNASPTESVEPEKTVSELIQHQDEQKAPILKFLNFLASAEPVDYTLSGYFCKVLKVIFQKEPARVAELLYNSTYYQKIASHIYSDSMVEVLLAILKLDTSHFRSTPGEHYITQRTEIVEQLVKNLNKNPSNSEFDLLHFDRQNNSSLILCTLLSAVTCYPNGKSVVSALLRPETLYQLNQGLLNPCLTKVLLPLTKQLCSYHKGIYSSSDKLPLLDLVRFTECIIPSEIPESDPFIISILGSLRGIIGSLESDGQAQAANSFSYNPNQRKISLCEALFSFIRLQNDTVDNNFIECKGFEALLKMFTQNPWNNILHSELVKLFTFAIKHGSNSIKQALFEQANILEFITQESKDPQIDFPSKKSNKTAKSYIAHLNVLATAIDTSQDPIIKTFVENHKDWQPPSSVTESKEEELPIEKEPSPKVAAPLFGLEEMTSGPDDDDGANMCTPMSGPKFSMGGGFSLSFGQEEDDSDDGGWPVRDPEKTPKASKNIEWDDF